MKLQKKFSIFEVEVPKNLQGLEWVLELDNKAAELLISAASFTFHVYMWIRMEIYGVVTENADDKNEIRFCLLSLKKRGKFFFVKNL